MKISIFHKFPRFVATAVVLGIAALTSACQQPGVYGGTFANRNMAIGIRAAQAPMYPPPGYAYDAAPGGYGGSGYYGEPGGGEYSEQSLQPVPVPGAGLPVACDQYGSDYHWDRTMQMCVSQHPPTNFTPAACRPGEVRWIDDPERAGWKKQQTCGIR